jgi:ribosomal protein S18 acetylase RimI-like enzyme
MNSWVIPQGEQNIKQLNEIRFKIKATTENDWEILKKVRLDSLEESPDAFAVSYADASKLSDEEWKDRASANQEPRFFLAYNESEPIGIIGGVFVGSELELISMWVRPMYRGNRIGVQLIETIQHYAINRGHTGVCLKVSPDNVQACSLYRKCGFVFVDESEELASNDNITLQKMVWTSVQSG